MKQTLFPYAALLALTLQPLAANQPNAADMSLSGRFTAKSVVLHFANNEKTPVLLVISASADSTVRFASTRVNVGGGQTLDFDLGALDMPTGLHVFHLESKVFDGKQNLPVGPGPFLYQPLMVDGNGPAPLSYESAFLGQRKAVPGKSDQAVIDLGGFREVSQIGAMAFDSVDSSSVDRVASLNPQVSPFDLSKLDNKQTPRVGEVAGDTSDNRPRVAAERLEGPAEKVQDADLQAQLAQQRIHQAAGIFSTGVTGRFSLRLPGNQYQAAWGWVVRVWQDIGFWRYVGWAYVDGNGYWTVSYPAGTVLPGFPVRVEYRPANRFVQLQDPNGNVYTWGDNWNLGGDLTNIGHRSANFSLNGDLPGVDKLYVGATNEWKKMYDFGINPLRDQPIRVTFPNSLASGFCQQGTPAYAWSCSYWSDGRIYIIPAHASPSVVQHEIAHSVNSWFWNGNLPSGAGGQHNLTSCYNNGLALTEGFADFVAYWVQLDRNTANPTIAYMNTNIETLPSGTCSGQTNEMRVAATFWDTYDVPNDGSGNSIDDLYYVNQGVPVAIYLNNPANAMADYLPIMQSGQSAFWQGEFTKLYRRNTIVP